MPVPWIVLKFGGTSVAHAHSWDRIADRVRVLLPGHRVWIVASAISGVTNLLESAVREALEGRGEAEIDALRAEHSRLADELSLTRAEREPVWALLDELDSRVGGIRLTGEAPPRLLARVLATGELASTRLGAAALARRGIEARWIDARTLLHAPERGRRSEHQHYLEADVRASANPALADEAAAGSRVVLTQGFIAGAPEGETCLLGRGGSDTSGALFAALVEAERLEIWSDVHGLFTADPRLVPVARLIRRIGYREARELAAMGARVLHPRCLGPVRDAGIPVTLHALDDPEREGTRIEATDEQHPAVTAVTCRRGATLVTISTLAMWETPGFLARAFVPFEEHDVSVDLVATSQSAISVTLDRVPGGVEGPAFGALVDQLEELGRVEVIHPCGVVSIIGRRIRAALPELGPALEVFRERRVHLVSSSSEDLNLSFVVDEEHAIPLVGRLHERLFPAQGGDPRLGDTWESLERPRVAIPAIAPWWRSRAQELSALVADGNARYVYHLPTVRARAKSLVESLPSVRRFYYSMKANSNPAVLAAIAGEGFGIECVSAAEVLEARRLLGSAVPLLFTPNFCPFDEYRVALEAGAQITVDGPEPLEARPHSFRGASIAVRVDPGRGYGHHSKVWTAGARAKFGQPRDGMRLVAEAASSAGARIVGLHAHVGSGILDPATWGSTADALSSLLPGLDDVEWLDLGGGLGVPERPEQRPLDLAALELALSAVLSRLPRAVTLRMEPGRFLVSEAGVLVAPVTQVRHKGDQAFIGLATGMNSLIRPALYGAWHGIHNLSRLDEPPSGYWNVVGPICETSDVLGSDRLLPDTEPGDVVLIENAGAYGRVMASRYNLREPAAEVVLER